MWCIGFVWYITGRSVTLDWLRSSLKVWGTWWREWTSIDFTLTTVRLPFFPTFIGVFECDVVKRVCLPPSPLQEQQAHPHHHPQPPRAHDRRWCCLHRLHPPDAVCGRAGTSSLQPIRRDQGMAPQGQPVAERPLPLLWSSCCPAAGMRYPASSYNAPLPMAVTRANVRLIEVLVGQRECTFSLLMTTVSRVLNMFIRGPEVFPKLISNNNKCYCYLFGK